MVIKIKDSYFEVLKNTKDALNIEQLTEAYIEEWYDSFPYIVGDISDLKLRLKHFSEKKESNDYFHKIPDYIIESCTYKPAYFILHRITEADYLARKDEKITEGITSGDTEVFKMEKVPFDKENLKLEKTEKNKPNIRIDIQKETAVKTFPLPEDLLIDIQKEKQQEQRNRQQSKFNKQNNRQTNNNNNNSNNGNNNKNQKTNNQKKNDWHNNKK